MAGVIKKFFVASMFMWVVPIAILYGFKHNLFPGIIDLSSSSLTLSSGFLAVISVDVVIAFYICLAMREPLEKHEPDPKFVPEANWPRLVSSSLNLMKQRNLRQPLRKKSKTV